VSKVAIPKIVSARMRSEADRGRTLLPPSENNNGAGGKGFKMERVNRSEAFK